MMWRISNHTVSDKDSLDILDKAPKMQFAYIGRSMITTRLCIFDGRGESCPATTTTSIGAVAIIFGLIRKRTQSQGEDNSDYPLSPGRCHPWTNLSNFPREGQEPRGVVSVCVLQIVFAGNPSSAFNTRRPNRSSDINIRVKVRNNVDSFFFCWSALPETQQQVGVCFTRRSGKIRHCHWSATTSAKHARDLCCEVDSWVYDKSGISRIRGRSTMSGVINDNPGLLSALTLSFRHVSSLSLHHCMRRTVQRSRGTIRLRQASSEVLPGTSRIDIVGRTRTSSRSKPIKMCSKHQLVSVWLTQRRKVFANDWFREGKRVTNEWCWQERHGAWEGERLCFGSIGGRWLSWNMEQLLWRKVRRCVVCRSCAAVHCWSKQNLMLQIWNRFVSLQQKVWFSKRFATLKCYFTQNIVPERLVSFVNKFRQDYRLVQWTCFSDVTECTWSTYIQWRQRTLHQAV